MKLPQIFSEIAADDHVHLIFSSGFMYLAKQGSAETTSKIVRLTYDKVIGEWVPFDPKTVGHAARRPLARAMYRRGLKITEIAKIFNIEQQHVKSDVAAA